jgi:hypothetical protein
MGRAERHSPETHSPRMPEQISSKLANLGCSTLVCSSCSQITLVLDTSTVEQDQCALVGMILRLATRQTAGCPSLLIYLDG